MTYTATDTRDPQCSTCAHAPGEHPAPAATADPAVAHLQRDGGWGPWIRVTVAATPAADAAAADYFRRRSTLATRHAASLDEDATTDLAAFPALADVFYPTCEHGMSAHLCEGPMHYMTADQECERGW